MEKISRKGFLKVAAAAAMSGVTAGALAACNSAASSSTAASGDAIYTAGTYTGTATGIGEVKVTMTFSETAITEVVIDASNETESIGGVAAPTLQEAIMAAQGTEIDNISGATVTTNAVKKAAASCIEQAMGVKADGADGSAAASENDWLGTEPEIDESKVTKTVDVDVAVVGCGVAGVAAVRSIAEDGGKVAAFEKADGPQCRSGEYAVINGNVQAKWGRNTWTREQIDEIVDSHMVESTYRCKRSIMSKWAHNIGDAFDWWVEANPELYYAETTRSAIPDENANNFLIPIFYPLPENYDWKQERFPCYPTSVEFLPTSPSPSMPTCRRPLTPATWTPSTAALWKSSSWRTAAAWACMPAMLPPASTSSATPPRASSCPPAITPRTPRCCSISAPKSLRTTSSACSPTWTWRAASPIRATASSWACGQALRCSRATHP